MNQAFLLLLVILIVSGCENHSRGKGNSVTVESKTKTQNIKIDSITSVDICYYPAFENSSVLQIDRLTGEGVFAVDTAIGFNYGRPDTIKFVVSDMESKTDIESFWKPSFIHSIQQDTSMLGWTDGMSVWVIFTNSTIRDSVYLGNVYPKAVDSLIMRQFEYLEKKTTNRSMKDYLRKLKKYL